MEFEEGWFEAGVITWYGENTAQKMKVSIKDFFSKCAVKGSKAWPYVSHNYIKNAKKRVCIAKGEGGYIHGVIFIYVRCSISKFIRKNRVDQERNRMMNDVRVI